MGWQEIAVAIVGFAVGILIVWRAICAVRHKDYNPCAGCDKQCPLKTGRKKKEID
ncbi:MAG: hypothetical protein RSB23_07335 [Alistipes sp.]